MDVRWNAAKARANARKHSVTFHDAATVFADNLAVSLSDEDHSDTENRFIVVGESARGRLLFVVYTIREDVAWLISARPATHAEGRRYMKGDRIRDAVRVEEEEDVTAHLDWSKAVRGRHHIPMREIPVTIDKDLSLFFSNSEDVNAVLRICVEKAIFPPPR